MARRLQRYGSNATEIKADVVTAYVAFYGRAFKKTNFETAYFDAFAGSGWTDTGNTDEARGVALRVLEAPDPLAYYAFNDIKKSNIESLRSAVDAMRVERSARGLATPHADFTTQDGNHAINTNRPNLGLSAVSNGGIL